METKKSLTNFILLALEKSIEGYISFEDFAYNPHKHIYGYPRNLKKPLILQAIKRLRQNGLIDLIGEEELLIKLTDKGLDKAVWAKIKFETTKKWDKIWRIVIFDIPEDQRLARDLLRFKLKEWGFVKIQKSVWASKKNCTVPLRKYIKQLGISDWVLVIESNNTGF